MKLIFDVGMFDGSDTRYYLSKGYKVIAVEANPNLVRKNKDKFREMLASGQLVLVDRAICENSGDKVFLNISGDDLGSSSIFGEKISNKSPLGSYTVEGITVTDLIEKYGQPYYMKVDVEGADRFCVLQLKENNRPDYVSFEAGDDVDEMIRHLKKIGYSKFKAINQCNFLELGSQESFFNRAKRKVMYLLGYKEPRYVRINNRFFLSEHSSGPVPWESDGKWQDAEALLGKWEAAKSNNRLKGWYDIHAK